MLGCTLHAALVLVNNRNKRPRKKWVDMPTRNATAQYVVTKTDLKSVQKNNFRSLKTPNRPLP